jgi:hypothetical protein
VCPTIPGNKGSYCQYMYTQRLYISLSRSPTVTELIFQGTGGVNMFALLVCLATAIRPDPVITSSSDKLLGLL